MEPTQGNLSAVFTGFDARFRRALLNVPVPAVGRMVARGDGVGDNQDYPMMGLLGDLVAQEDELIMADIWAMIQRATPAEYSLGLPVRRADILNDRFSLYNGPISQLAVLAATHAMRNVAPTFMAGFTVTWAPDGAMVFSSTHQWPGGLAWDNREHLPLTGGNFDLACLHLETRQGPNGQPMGLSPKVLVCGPLNRAVAENILVVRTLAGGADNRQYKRCELLILPRITNLNWFVVDDDPYNVGNLPGREGEEEPEGSVGIRPFLLDVREDVRTASQTSEDSDEVFERSIYRYKAAMTYALLIIAPWLIQASDWEDEDSTTTTAAA